MALRLQRRFGIYNALRHDRLRKLCQRPVSHNDSVKPSFPLPSFRHHFYLMGEDNYKKFQRTSAEKFLHIQDGYHYCPFSDCGASFIIEESDEDGEGKRNICPECQRLFCLKCKSRGDCVCSTVTSKNV